MVSKQNSLNNFGNLKNKQNTKNYIVLALVYNNDPVIKRFTLGVKVFISSSPKIRNAGFNTRFEETFSL